MVLSLISAVVAIEGFEFGWDCMLGYMVDSNLGCSLENGAYYGKLLLVRRSYKSS